MTSNQLFFEKQRQPAAVFKHALLAHYITVFGAMTSAKSAGNRVWYIDGYAGPGLYEPQPGETHGQAGSPMLALGTARKLANFKINPRDLRCAFIEMNKNHATKLETVMAGGAFPGFHYTVLSGPVEAHLDDVVAAAGSDPLLTFLDPFGTSLPWEQMSKTLFGRPKNTVNEVLLNMNLDSLRRIGGLLGREDTSSAADQKTLSLLDNFLGNSNWRELFLEHYRAASPGTATAAALAVARQFRTKVYNETGYRSFTVPVRKQIDHEPIFLMTLFFTYSGAAYKFANAASSASESWRKSLHEEKQKLDAARHSDTLFGDDFNEATFEQQWKHDESELRLGWEAIIADNMGALLAEKGPFKVIDHLAEIYGPALGLAREMHLRAAWRALAVAGKAEAPPTGKVKLEWAIVRPAMPSGF